MNQLVLNVKISFSFLLFMLSYQLPILTNSCFQLIPEITSLTPITTALPLFGVLTLTAIKYAYDDVVKPRFIYHTTVHICIKRHKLKKVFIEQSLYYYIMVIKVIVKFPFFDPNLEYQKLD